MIYLDYSKEQLEREADKLNEKFDRERLIRPKTIDVYEVVDLIGCTPDWLYLSPDGSIMGLAAFNKGLYPAWYPLEEATEYVPMELRYKGMYPKRTLVEKGTIVIDRGVNESGDVKTENFSCIHECFHQLLHSRCFKRPKNNYQHFCKRKAFRIASQDFSNMTAIDKIEHQANYAAAAFLMPREAVKSLFLERLGVNKIPCQPLEHTFEIDEIIQDMSDSFSVNYSPMKFRLQDMGILARNELAVNFVQ